MKGRRMTTFTVGFDGPSVKDGEIDVASLAPALLALGELVDVVNQTLNGTRAEAKLKLKASQHGSFDALLSLDISFITDMLDHFSAHKDRISTANDLLDLLLKGGAVITGTGTAIGGSVYGLFAALKFLKGKRPSEVRPNSDGTTTTIVVNNTEIIVDNRTVVLLNDVKTRTATEKFVSKSLSQEGITSLYFVDGAGDKSLGKDVELVRADLPAMRVPEPEADAETVVVEAPPREVLLRIISAQFEDGYLWRFSDGTNTFTARVEDIEFLNALDKSEIALSKDDTLRCIVSERQELKDGRLKSEAKIVEVLQHISGAKQLRLL